MPEQPTTYTLQSEEQLLTLLDMKYGLFLVTQFKGGATASEVARKMGEPAPRVSYRVKRLMELGLLAPDAVQGRGKRLRPVADRYVVPPQLMGLLSQESLRPLLATLSEAFLAATPWHMPDPDKTVTLLDFTQEGEQQQAQRLEAPLDSAQLLIWERQLKPDAYDRLIQELWERLTEKNTPGEPPAGAQTFTIALMGFPGSLLSSKE